MSEASAPAAAKISDWQRFKAVGKVHGIAFLAAVTLFGAADAWVMTSDLLLAQLISVLNALAAGMLLATLFHEWGHFAGARLSRSYSPMVREPKNPLVNPFIFGFNFQKNSRSQFLAMSLGGITANWLLVAAVLLLVPLDTWGRAMLLAVAVARAISVIVFEGPIVYRTAKGGEPEAELDAGLSNGSGDRGQMIGFAAGAAIWLLTI